MRPCRFFRVSETRITLMPTEMPDGMMAAAMMASAAREAEERKRRGHTKMVNELIQVLPPDLIVERLKGVLYRNLSILESWQKSEEANAGQDMLAQSMFNLATAVGEAVKWIAVHNGLDPYEPYGDDSYVVRVQDIVLGVEIEEDGDEEESEYEKELAPVRKREYHSEQDETDDEL
jgi:hypothetical protein